MRAYIKTTNLVMPHCGIQSIELFVDLRLCHVKSDEEAIHLLKLEEAFVWPVRNCHPHELNGSWPCVSQSCIRESLHLKFSTEGLKYS